MSRGIVYVLDCVDVELIGDVFNFIIWFEIYKFGKLFNLMINVGVIIVVLFFLGEMVYDKLEYLFFVFEKLIGKWFYIYEEVFCFEWQIVYWNRVFVYYLKEMNFFEVDVEEMLEVYLKQCVMEGIIEDIVLIGLIFVYDGYYLICWEQVILKDVVKFVKVLMLMCGMYNVLGKYVVFVGVLVKSGVFGGIMVLVFLSVRREQFFYNGCGIGIYGLVIDEYGNSLMGGMLLKYIVQEWEFSIF